MKVRISYTVDVDDHFRRALNFHFGRKGLATREQMRTHCEQVGNANDDDILYEYQQAHQRKKHLSPPR